MSVRQLYLFDTLDIRRDDQSLLPPHAQIPVVAGLFGPAPGPSPAPRTAGQPVLGRPAKHKVRDSLPLCATSAAACQTKVSC
jgi:hypothetical protein